MSPHKDNGIRVGPNLEQKSSAYSRNMNSQIFGTNVITITLEGEMDFSFFTPKKRGDYNAPQKDHERNPHTSRNLSLFSVLVLDPRDDEEYMHGISFSHTQPSRPNRIRICIVFRWASKRVTYRCEDAPGPNKFRPLFARPKRFIKEHSKFGVAWMEIVGL